jgi:hypothetical protein
MAEPKPATNRPPVKPDERHLERLDRAHYNKHTSLALGVMFALVLAMVAGAILWHLLSRGPTVVANRFVELAAKGKVDRAYIEASSIELRQRMSLEQFTTLLDAVHMDKARKVTWTVRHQDADRAEAVGQFILDGGATETLTMSFIEEFDDWKVDDLALVLPR